MALDIIYQAGDDALGNQFQVIIPAFPNVIDIGKVNIRVLTCQIPDLIVGSYDVHYSTDKFSKPSGKSDLNKEVMFTFRIDKYWQVYNSFRQWHGLIINQDTGAMSPDNANNGLGGGNSPIRVPFSIQTIDSNGILTGGAWNFEGGWPSNVNGVEFSQDNGDPLIANITMKFIKML
jgi:hypothetical protein